MAGFVDLFAGAGGTALGFKMAGFNHLDSYETDPKAKTTYFSNIGGGSKPNSVEEFDPSKLENPKDTVIIGCPPCQGFTRLKKSGLRDERNSLTVLFAKKAAESDARVIFFENVSTITLHPEFNRLVSILRRRGYRPVWDVLDATRYGVPQRRKRLILVAAKQEKLDLSPATEGELDEARKSGLPVARTVREAIWDLRNIKPGSKDAPSNHVTMNHTDKVLKRIRLIPKNGGGQKDLPDEMRYDCHMKENRGYSDVLGRMKWEEPAPTVTTGCTNATKGRFVHPSKDRPLTVREAARIQTFPDDFVFHGGLLSSSTQVGNAVPPVLAFVLARRILLYFD